MRLAPIVAAAVAVAVLHFAPLPAFAQEAPTVCQYTMAGAVQELTAAKDDFTIIEGAEKDEFLADLAASYKLKTGKDIPAIPPVRRVLLVVMEKELFFGLEFENGCLSSPLPLALFLHDAPRSGRDATGTHA